MEIQVWPCEKSTRQQWQFDHSNSNSGSGSGSPITLNQKLTWTESNSKTGKDEELSGYLCFGGPEGWMPDRPYLSLVNCDPLSWGAEDHPPLRFFVKDDGYIVETVTGKCVGLAEGSMESGALLGLQECIKGRKDEEEEEEHSDSHRAATEEKEEKESTDTGHLMGSQSPKSRKTASRPQMRHAYQASPQHQLFKYDASTGEVKLSPESGFKESMCLTAGWPFLTGAAFQDKDQSEVIVVVMNEAAQDTKITLQDSKKGTGWLGISGRSMQTIIY
tara:strand:- start:122 stop:946 length:825 start_codon:yes stop_codon:yes gene_type:complete